MAVSASFGGGTARRWGAGDARAEGLVARMPKSAATTVCIERLWLITFLAQIAVILDTLFPHQELTIARMGQY